MSAVKIRHRNGHDATPGIESALNGSRSHRQTLLEGVSYECIRCDAPISPEKFAALATEDLIRRGEIEAEIRAQVAQERDAEIERMHQEMVAKIDAADRALAKRETTIRKEAATVANAAVAPKLAKAEEGRKALERQMKALRASQETIIAERLAAQREKSVKAIDDAVLVERAKWATEKLGMESQLQDMQRRLQAKTAHQLGEPGEVDLFERLTAAFPGDRISRVVKGVPGCDVLVEVIHNGEVVGKIALDSKVHARWQNKFTTKLRADQLAENADYAILSSSVFPAGAKQLHLQDGVLVADPTLVPVLVNLLRGQITESHRLRLSAQARDEKAEKLLAFVVSPTCTDLLDRIVKLTDDLATLDLKEISTHETTWKKRGELIRGVQAIHDQFSAAVSAIISGDRS